MIILDRLAELRYRNSFLYRIGLIHFIIFFLLLIGVLFDPREVLGINTWIKPMKFCLSIGIYTWTFAWLMFDLANHQKWVKFLSKVIGISMLTEIIIILYQASRATPSHFNFSTPFDVSLFAVMGIMISINFLVALVVFILYLKKNPILDAPYLLAVRLGLFIFLVGNYIGKVMVDRNAHAVGVEDGGPGLPFVNWSIEGGDLRISHFLGLHAIQLIPLFAYVLGSKTDFTPRTRIILVALFSAVYGAIFSVTYLQAMRGLPFIS